MEFNNENSYKKILDDINSFDLRDNYSPFFSLFDHVLKN